MGREGTLNKGVKHVVEVISTNENRRDNNLLPVVGLSPSNVVKPRKRGKTTLLAETG
jgi:hypothetical protein